jgi:predicted nucleic acid-binding protein
MNDCFVLDACALLRFLMDEPGAEKVEQYLYRAEAGELSLLIHIINLGEVIYRVGKVHGWTIAERKRKEISFLPIQVVEFSDKLFWQAVEIKSQYAMSYADCFAAALTMQSNATLLTSDPEFQVLEKQLKQMTI